MRSSALTVLNCNALWSIACMSEVSLLNDIVSAYRKI
jgi:hypothetical protein